MKDRKRAAEDETFRDAVRDVRPMAPTNRVTPWRTPPPPVPLKRREDERAVLEELAHLARDRGCDAPSNEDDTDVFELEDDWAYLRPGLPREILRKLRRTHWAIQDHLDLHGMTGDEAVEAMAQFLAACRRQGLRCVRIVHGKGLRSVGREPVLKRRVRRLLPRRSEVLAYVEPRSVHGGGGAVVVLLDA